MRIGSNPAKQASRLDGYGLHRIIVPVYIPHHDGYFAHAPEVTRLCLQSLHLTTRRRAAITVVANGCAPDVVATLNGYFAEGWFDQLVINNSNRGKVDAIASVARGSFEPLVTICDNDVLFRFGWLEAVEQVFNAFPEAGAVCPFPCPTLMWHHTSATWLGGLLRRELRFLKVADDLALDRLSRSFGQADYVKPELRKAQLVAQRGGHTACVGATHIVCTLRRDVIAHMPQAPSLKAIASGSEATWFDAPNDRRGYWRLSTTRAWASHMGNAPEPWMTEEFAGLVASVPTESPLSAAPTLANGRRSVIRVIPHQVRRKLLNQFQRAGVRRALFRRLGYSADSSAAVEEPRRVTDTAT